MSTLLHISPRALSASVDLAREACTFLEAPGLGARGSPLTSFHLCSLPRGESRSWGRRLPSFADACPLFAAALTFHCSNPQHQHPPISPSAPLPALFATPPFARTCTGYCSASTVTPQERQVSGRRPGILLERRKWVTACPTATRQTQSRWCAVTHPGQHVADCEDG